MRKFLSSIITAALVLSTGLHALAAPLDTVYDPDNQDYTVMLEEVQEASVSSLKVKLSASSFTYNGKVQKPRVTVTTNTGKAVANKYYKVNWPSGCKNVGTYKVNVKFTSKYNNASVPLSFVIKPPKPGLQVTSTGDSSLKLKFTGKNSQVDGYRLNVATPGTSAKKIKTTKGTYTLKDLKSNTDYSLKLQTYKRVGGKTYYSPWTKVVSVKTKGGSSSVKKVVTALELYEGNVKVTDVENLKVDVTVPSAITYENKKQAVLDAVRKKYTLKGRLDSASGGGLITINNPRFYTIASRDNGETLIAALVIYMDMEDKDYSISSSAGNRFDCTVFANITVKHTGVDISDSEVRSKILAYKSKPGFTEGSPWTNEANIYVSHPYLNGTIGNLTTTGCEAFAMQLTDEIFGKDAPIMTHNDINKVKVGDMVMLNYGAHTVLVYEINGTTVTVAEGAYRDTVHWGRQIDLRDANVVSIWTRR